MTDDDDDGYLHLVFEQADTSLDKYLSSLPLQSDQALLIALDVAKGMVHLAEHGIVHRDIRLDNILLITPHLDEEEARSRSNINPRIVAKVIG